MGVRGHVLNELAELAAARAAHTQSRDLYQQLGNHAEADLARMNLGCVELAAAELDAARANFSEALIAFRDRNQPLDAAFAAFNLGLVDLLQSNHPVARSLFGQTFTAAQRLNHRELVAVALLGLALAAAAPEAAATVHGASDAVLDQLSHHEFERFEATLRTEDHSRLRVLLGDDAFEAAYDRGDASRPRRPTGSRPGEFVDRRAQGTATSASAGWPPRCTSRSTASRSRR